MNHQLFEDLIFTQDALTQEQALALQEHLQSCETCSALASAWRQVTPMFAAPVMLEPSPGFVSRWQQTLEMDRERSQRRQSLVMFALGIGLASIFLVLLAIGVLYTFNSPLEWFLTLTSRLATLFFLADAFRDSFVILRTALPVSWWISGGLAVVALCILWIFSLQKLATAGRTSS
ncbi:MAG: anti-sigma factor family protein [Anaerolineales bacterium]|jgi:predicted anti-sigma-YlaC factor YlaD